MALDLSYPPPQGSGQSLSQTGRSWMLKKYLEARALGNQGRSWWIEGRCFSCWGAEPGPQPLLCKSRSVQEEGPEAVWVGPFSHHSADCPSLEAQPWPFQEPLSSAFRKLCGLG